MDAATAGIAVDPGQGPTPVRPRSRLLAAAVVAILLAGLGSRLGYAWEGRAPVFDAAAYARIAANLDRGRGFTLGKAATQPAGDYSPGVPLLAAGIYKLSGGVHERLARLVLALIGSLAVLFAYLIGRRLAGPAAGLLAATATAVYPALLEYQGMLMGEPLAATLLSGGVLATLWASGVNHHRSSGGWREEGVYAEARRPVFRPTDSASRGSSSGEKPSTKQDTPSSRQDPPARWLVPGFLLGALALVRPEYLAVALLLAVVVGARYRTEWRTGLVRAAILLLGVAIVVAPWTVRNAIALHRFVPVSTGGGQVLFAGTYMPSGGNPERVGRAVLERHPALTRQLAARYLPALRVPAGRFDAHGGTSSPQLIDAVLARVRLEQILAALAAQRYPDMESDRALARMGREQLWRDVSERPLGYAGFLATKLARLWWHGPRDVMRRPPWEELHWALLALGLVGLAVLARRRRWEAAVLATVLLTSTATGAVLVASPRRVLVMLPLLAALAGVGAIRLFPEPFDELTPV